MAKAVKSNSKADEPARCYSIQLSADGEAEIYLYDYIGEFWGEGVSAKTFALDVKTLGDVKKITLHLNSGGGDVFEGVAMYNVLLQHKAEIVVSIDGLAASAASVLAMAGDDIAIADNGMIMIHEASGAARGRAGYLRSTAEALDKINASAVKTYLRHSNLSDERIVALMAEEKWMSSDEAVDWGFAHRKTEPMNLAAVATMWDFSRLGYEKVPELFHAGEDQFDARQQTFAMVADATDTHRASSTTHPGGEKEGDDTMPNTSELQQQIEAGIKEALDRHKSEAKAEHDKRDADLKKLFARAATAGQEKLVLKMLAEDKPIEDITDAIIAARRKELGAGGDPTIDSVVDRDTSIDNVTDEALARAIGQPVMSLD